MTTLSTNHCCSPSPDAAAEIRRWLSDFAAAVRDVDYDSAAEMFADDVVSFGTFATVVRGRDALVAEQWKNIWGITRRFEFALQQVHCQTSGEIAWVAAPWTSQGRDPDGNWFDRPGRCTLVLRRAVGAKSANWLCVHSHFSLAPQRA